jgi:hypothetical protein
MIIIEVVSALHAPGLYDLSVARFIGYDQYLPPSLVWSQLAILWRNSGNDPFGTPEAAPGGNCCRCGRLTGQKRRRYQSGQLRLKLGRAFIRAHHAFKFGKPSPIE